MAKVKEIKTEDKNSKIKWLIGIAVIIICGLLTGAGIKMNIDFNNLTATIEYSGESQPAIITEENGIDLEGEVPTVESVDNNMQFLDPEAEECPEGEECGMGSADTC